MKRSFIPVLARLTRLARCATFALLAILCSACGTSPATGAQLPTRASATQYTAALRPLNASRVSGTARITVTGNALTVSIHASGLEPDREHYQHIHGTPGGMVACPTAAHASASGLLTVDRGLAVVGPIALDLSPHPHVTRSGPSDWSQTYTLTANALATLPPLTGHAVVGP